MQKGFLSIGVVLFLSFIFIGCSSMQNGRTWQQGQNMPQWRNQNISGQIPASRNLADEQRDQVIQEREQQAQDACVGKAEGDSCSIENPMGQMEGTCTQLDNKLVCFNERYARYQ